MPTPSSSTVTPMIAVVLLIAALAMGLDPGEESAPPATAEDSLRATETAFAQTMADRDHAAFTSFLDSETVFFGRAQTYRGSAAVATAWKPFFDGPTAPFSWAPEAVAVLSSGDLGLTSGPVLDPEGQRIGTFNSVWRKDENGAWKVVFDRGCPPCTSR